MAVTLLAGAESSTDNTSNNPIDMADKIAELEPNVAPLVLLASKMGKVAATNPKIEWQEDESMPRVTTISATIVASSTPIGVTADIFRVGDLVRITTQGEGLEVTATAAGSITAVRSIGSMAAASAISGSELFLVGNANAEGSLLREIKYPQLVSASNYNEIVRTPFGVTGTEDATKHYGGDERDRLRAKFGKEHARTWEQIAFFGARDLNSTNKRFCGGLKEFITTNITADTGGLAEADWQTFLQAGFRYGSERKVAFGSSKFISALEGYARTNLRVVDDHASTYGIKMSTYISGHGTVDIVHHRDWQDSTIYGGYCFLVDMDNVKLRPLRDTKLYPNRQAPDYDGFKDEYLTEMSLQVTHERTHSILTGIT